MADAKDALGEEILVDPGTPEKDRAKHPSGLPEKEADKASGTTIADAESNDPPIRTNRPDVDVIQRLGTGAGQHTPPNDPHIDTDGRFIQPALRDETTSSADAVKDAKK